jgi:hypothetical protein
MRLVRAEVLKLRRRRGMLALCALLTVGGVAGLFVARAVMGDPLREAGVFDDAVGVLTMTGAIVGVIVGATAGGADIEAGVFRDLAATGRSRVELLLARVPGAWVVVLPLLVLAVAPAGAVTGAGGGDLGGGLASVLAAGAVTSTVCVGLGALMGSRGMVIGVALAFQLGISPLLGQIEAIGDARWGIPAVAVSRLSGDAELGLTLGLAIAILLAWCGAALVAGAWRTTTQEI